MASNNKKKKGKINTELVLIQKLAAGVSLLALAVITAVGIVSRVSVTTIAIRATIVVIVVGFITRLLLKIVSTYEEMNSGQT